MRPCTRQVPWQVLHVTFVKNLLLSKADAVRDFRSMLSFLLVMLPAFVAGLALTPCGGPRLTLRSTLAARMDASLVASDEKDLLRLCALTDRGQRADPSQLAELRNIVVRLELMAPEANANDLNGEWRLLAACGESCYRSSYACRGLNPGLALPIPLLTSPAFELLCGQTILLGLSAGNRCVLHAHRHSESKGACRWTPIQRHFGHHRCDSIL